MVLIMFNLHCSLLLASTSLFSAPLHSLSVRNLMSTSFPSPGMHLPSVSMVDITHSQAETVDSRWSWGQDACPGRICHLLVCAKVPGRLGLGGGLEMQSHDKIKRGLILLFTISACQVAVSRRTVWLGRQQLQNLSLYQQKWSMHLPRHRTYTCMVENSN